MTAYAEGYKKGSTVGFYEEVINPYEEDTNQFHDWWTGFDDAIEDRIS